MTRSTELHGRVGDYVLEDALPSGGMAHVWRARDVRDGTVVALRQVRSETEGVLDAERRGARLQDALSRRDPRIPKIREIVVDEPDAFCVAMEFVPGRSLRARLREGPLPPREAAAVALEICGVLRTAHASPLPGSEHGRVVHGDIKPENVQLGADRTVRVLDFGIAKALTATGAVTTQPFASGSYASPERLETRAVDERSDLWSLGVLLYEMLAGRRPFDGGSGEETERNIRERRPPPLLAADAGALRAVAAKALAPSAARRYGTAEELGADLLAYLAGEPTLAEREGAAPAAAYEATSPASAGAAPLPLEVETTADDRTRPSGALAAAPAPGEENESTRPTRGPVPAATRPAPRPSPRRRLRRAAVVGFLLWAAITGSRLGSVMGDARELRAELASRDASDLDAVWSSWESIEGRSVLGMGPGTVRRPLADWLVAQAEPLLDDYRSERPTIREGGWRKAADLLERAHRLRPGDRTVEARLAYCGSHLDRIAGHDLRRVRRAEGDARLNEAVSGFRRAASLQKKWGDPYLGLGRVYLQEFDDLEQGEAAFAQARELGARLPTRDLELLADAYLRQSGRDRERAADSVGQVEEEALLRQVADHADKALQQYDEVARRAGAASVRTRAQTARLRREQARLRLDELASGGFWR